MEETGTEAGAVKYQICFPSKSASLNSFEAIALSSQDEGSNPAGGLYGARSSTEAVFEFDSLDSRL